MRILGIIPARYGSSRFPGKPLADINGKPMIQRVYEGARNAEVLSDLLVATDDYRIEEAVQAFGGKVIMTSEEHNTGTDRCREALDKSDGDFDIVINIQGDEPYVDATHINEVAACFDKESTQIGTLIKAISSKKELFDPNKPKVVVDANGRAIYFSRTVIPYMREVEETEWIKRHQFYKHIGIYAYRKNVLENITKLPQSRLELAEKLEQLRWLQNGYYIQTVVTESEALSVDTPQDLENLLRFREG